ATRWNHPGGSRRHHRGPGARGAWGRGPRPGRRGSGAAGPAVTPQVEAFLEMMAVERDASPHTLAAYARDLADADGHVSGGLMGADEATLEAWFKNLSRRGLSAATAARRRSA